MKVYFLQDCCGSHVIITDEITAKIYDGAPDGLYEGIDLYMESADVVNDLKQLFSDQDINAYEDIFCMNVVNYDDIKPDLEYAVLVWEEMEAK